MNQDRLKVLLVEDNPAQAELIEEILGGMTEPRYEVELVARVGAAESKLQAQRYDVLLLDLTLPDTKAQLGWSGCVERPRPRPSLC